MSGGRGPSGAAKQEQKRQKGQIETIKADDPAHTKRAGPPAAGCSTAGQGEQIDNGYKQGSGGEREPQRARSRRRARARRRRRHHRLLLLLLLLPRSRGGGGECRDLPALEPLLVGVPPLGQSRPVDLLARRPLVVRARAGVHAVGQQLEGQVLCCLICWGVSVLGFGGGSRSARCTDDVYTQTRGVYARGARARRRRCRRPGRPPCRTSRGRGSVGGRGGGVMWC